MSSAWDLTALINAADPACGQVERHLWLVRLMEWLRHSPSIATARRVPRGGRDHLPLVRLRHLLNVLDQHPELSARVRGVIEAFWRDIDAAALFGDFGFGVRQSLASELITRIGQRLLPGTPETGDLAQLFPLLFDARDDRWLSELDDALLARVAALLAPPAGRIPAALLDGLMILTSAIQAAGYQSALRQRMAREPLAHEPFRHLVEAANALRLALAAGDGHQGNGGSGGSAPEPDADGALALEPGAPPPAALQHATLLRALLDTCREAAASIPAHLEAYGVSVNIVYEVDQLLARTRRAEALLDCLIAPDPRAEGLRLLTELVRINAERRGVRPLLAQHYSLLARLVAERNAETGTHYITRSRAEYRSMLAKAAGGGAVIAGTTFVKFALAMLGLTAFWAGFWAGINYAASFVIVMLLHWTVATKQPAMTAPALAASLPRGEVVEPGEIEAVVDRVAQLIRSQMAGIIGNLSACVPLVLAVQLALQALSGEPMLSPAKARAVLEAQSLLGPTAFFAAFTGVLLFASSLIAGWAENAFVFHRLDSALAWNPRIVQRLGAPRAQRWAAWWRANVSGLAANVSLGLLLGLVPALLAFLAIPLDVRHVTLSSGQLAAGAAALGPAILSEPLFWWCLAAIPVIGALNLSVSFGLAFLVALRSRRITVHQRHAIYRALARRLRAAPLSFLRPPPGSP